MLFHSLHPQDSRRKIGTEKPPIGASYASRQTAAKRRLIVEDA
jgi:hypothetical protein